MNLQTPGSTIEAILWSDEAFCAMARRLKSYFVGYFWILIAMFRPRHFADSEFLLGAEGLCFRPL